MLGRKVGRPATVRRGLRLNFRFSKEEVELLEGCCKDLGKTKTDTIIDGLCRIRKSLDRAELKRKEIARKRADAEGQEATA